MGLNLEERKLILKLISDPLASVTKIASELNRSRPTVLSQFKRLKDKCKVQAFIKLAMLDLRRVNYFLECSFSNLPLLESIIDTFPYSNYRTRVIGRIKGLYVQFSIPNELNLDAFLSMLQNHGVIKERIDVTPSGLSSQSNFKLTQFDDATNDFQFNWKYFGLELDEILSNKSIPRNRKYSPFNEKILSEIEPVDMFILASMSDDARRRGSSLLSIAGETYSTEIPPYVLSHRISYIKSNLIDSYKVQLDWELFNIYQALIFHTPGPFEEKELENLGDLIKAKFPFDSVFTPINDNKGFSWFVAVPPSHFPSLLEFIWKFCRNIDFDCFSVDYRSSARYIFYGYSTFDFETRHWKTSDDFLFDEVRSLLGSP